MDDFSPFSRDEVKDATKTRLSQVLRAEGDKMSYEYDFGDGWRHDVLVEKSLPAEPDASYPVCIEGRRACPPEDIGAAYGRGYENLLQARNEPQNEGQKEMMAWLEDFDPEEFDMEAVNEALETLR